MTLLTSIPLVVAVNWLWSALLAVPAWLLWTVCGLGARYFAFLPTPWLSITLPQIAGLLLLLAIGRMVISPLKLDLKVGRQA